MFARGNEVTVIDNLSTARFQNIAHLEGRPGFRLVIDSITNETVMDRLVSECDVVFHLAAAVGVDLIVRDPIHVIETNVLGTHSVLKLANRYRRKVLITSTSEIYGKNTSVPFKEDDDRLLGPTTRARWSYSASKAVDEFLGLAYHRQTGLPVVIVRLFNTVGPRQTGQYGMVMPRFVQQALRGEPLSVYGDGQQTRCFCNVEDVVRAIVELPDCSQALGEVFNLGSNEEVTILELAEKVLRTVDEYRAGRSIGAPEDPEPVDHPGRIQFVPYDIAYESGFEDMRRRVPDISKVTATIGWEPLVPLEDTIQSILEALASESVPTDVGPESADRTKAAHRGGS